MAGCGQNGGEAVDGPVSVYVSLPLTGPRAAEGRDAADGAQLALEQAGGEAGGLEVQARVLDDARGGPWSPVAVGENARAAAQDSSTAAYIGELDSQPTRTSLPITNDAEILQISPGAGAVDLSAPAEGYPDSPGRYRPSGETSFARVVPGDDDVAAAAAELAIDLGMRRVAVATGDDAYGRLVAQEFEAAAADVGIEVEAPRRASRAAALLRAEADGDLVLEATAPGGTDHVVAAPLAPSNLPAAEFAGEFEQRFGRPPGPHAAYGYEAMGLALQGIEAAAGGDEKFRTGVTNAVLGAERPNSVLGTYSIGGDGETTLCALQPYSLEGGRSVPGRPICPPG
ncbi:MAG TPA: ABC transporter substrate-binding protein [Solirubrobacterales bacterium]|nr:ABC transporter substrate-binding protein [Solirubrobacterales bacterium]